MVGFKLVIGMKQGKCAQKEVQEPEAHQLLGKKIGEKISGDTIGFPGYEFEITGGSDHCGFPMRKDVEGAARKQILAVEGVGLKKKANGIRQRKTVCGNTVHDKIRQINMKVLKEGGEPLIAPPEPEEKPAEAPAEKAEEKPAEKPAEEKPAEAPAEKPAEEKPAEAPAEKAEEKPAEEKAEA